MTTDRKAEYLVGLLRELCKLPRETEWVEFKHNNADPQEIGEYLSALANAAALNGKAFAYLVWGVDDKTHNVVAPTSLLQAPGRAMSRWRPGCCACSPRRSTSISTS